MSVGCYYTSKSGKKRWHVVVQSGGKTYRPGKGYSSRVEALRAEAKLRLQLFSPEKISFKDCVERYMEHITAHGQSAAWIREKRYTLVNHLSAWNDMPIGKIDRQLIDNFIQKKKKEGITILS